MVYRIHDRPMASLVTVRAPRLRGSRRRCWLDQALASNASPWEWRRILPRLIQACQRYWGREIVLSLNFGEKDRDNGSS